MDVPGGKTSSLNSVSFLHYQIVISCPRMISIDQVPQLVMSIITSIHFQKLTTRNGQCDVLQSSY